MQMQNQTKPNLTRLMDGWIEGSVTRNRLLTAAGLLVAAGGSRLQERRVADAERPEAARDSACRPAHRRARVTELVAAVVHPYPRDGLAAVVAPGQHLRVAAAELLLLPEHGGGASEGAQRRRVSKVDEVVRGAVRHRAADELCHRLRPGRRRRRGCCRRCRLQGRRERGIH